MGPRAGLDRGGKYRPPPGFDPQTIQPVASRYTDYTTWPTINDVTHMQIYSNPVVVTLKFNFGFLFNVIYYNAIAMTFPYGIAIF